MIKKRFRCLLIDPARRTIEELEIAQSIQEIHRLVARDTIDSFLIAEFDDSYDYGWVADNGLSAGKPIHAFKFDNRDSPIAGRCLIVGCDRNNGERADTALPVAFAHQHIEWLGLILPKVTWVHDAIGSRATVSYERL